MEEDILIYDVKKSKGQFTVKYLKGTTTYEKTIKCSNDDELALEFLKYLDIFRKQFKDEKNLKNKFRRVKLNLNRWNKDIIPVLNSIDYTNIQVGKLLLSHLSFYDINYETDKVYNIFLNKFLKLSKRILFISEYKKKIKKLG